MTRYVKPKKGYIKRGKRFVARVTVDNKQINIGTFDTETEAHDAYLCAREKLIPAFDREKASKRYKEYKKIWYLENKKDKTKEEKEIHALRAREYRLNRTIERKILDAEKAKLKSRKWRSENKKHHLALTTIHKKIVKLRTPKWADRTSIKNFYTNCPSGHHVDHIIPLRGKIVCGLHVVNNLQYLTAKDNIIKNNKFNGEEKFFRSAA